MAKTPKMLFPLQAVLWPSVFRGKIIFFELQDATGRIQLFCRINALGEDVFAEMKDLDLGDWIGAHGLMMRTRRGQLSVAVDSFQLLSKALRPLPEKFHGLNDKETRYRQRYVDLIVNDEVRDTFQKRSKILSAFRRYMEADGYYEVETPSCKPCRAAQPLSHLLHTSMR